MKRSELVEIAHLTLQNPDQAEVKKLLDAVNLSRREREVIVKSEIGNISLETICNDFDNWKGVDTKGNKTICSYPHIVRIKTTGMKKIGQYLKDNKKIKRK